MKVLRAKKLTGDQAGAKTNNPMRETLWPHTKSKDYP